MTASFAAIVALMVAVAGRSCERSQAVRHLRFNSFHTRDNLPSRFRTLAFVGALLSFGQRATPQQTGVSVTFIANEGVLISGGGKKVLIDALYMEYDGYPIAADSTQARLARARAPFDSVDLVLVTHRHGDHFHPAPVVSHLATNPRTMLLSSGQVIDSLRSRIASDSDLWKRIASRTTRAGSIRRETHNGVKVEIFGVPHTGGFRHRAVEHLGFIVELGGRRVLHLGDTGTDEEAFSVLRLDTARVDVAFVPAWMVTDAEGRRVIERWIRAKQVVAIHMGPRSTQREIQAALPGAVAFNRSLEVRRW